MVPCVPAATFQIANGDVAALVAALQTANSNRADDTINLAPGGTYVLTTAADSLSGLPAVGNDGEVGGFHRLTINGNGATILRSTAPGTPEFRLFTAFNTGDGAQCTVIGVQFSNGRITTTDALGGGVLANGHVTLANCIINNCSAPVGGGVACENGTLEMLGCAVFDNYAQNVGGGLSNGPEFNRASVTTLINCTFARNSARLSGGFLYNNGTLGPGNLPDGGATVRMVHCTVVGGDVYNDSFNNIGVVIFNNTILDGVALTLYSNPGNYENKFISEGRNLCSGGGDGYLNDPTDQLNAAPRLDPLGLRMNGGPTPTIALQANSPAIDRGTSAGTLSDQRGSQRPSDLPFIPNGVGSDGSDIGAYEVLTDPVQANPLVVTTLADHDDGVAGLSDCTLREAIARANQLGVATISFAPGLAGTLTLDRNLGPLSISSVVTLQGPGARNIAVSGGGYVRVLQCQSGATTIRGLTLRDGSQASGAAGTTMMGGGILNNAVLRLENCALVHHVALGVTGVSGGGTAGSGGSGRGAAIYNNGTLALLRCTITDCVAAGGYGTDTAALLGSGGAGGSGEGAALYNAPGATADIAVSSLIRNSAGGASGGNAYFGGRGGNGTGGAIHNLGTLTIDSCTVSQNYGGGGLGGDGSGLVNDGSTGIGNGGLFNAAPGIVNLRNTICASNTAGGVVSGPDVRGPFVSLGFNLIGVTNQSTGLTAVSDLTGSLAAPLNPLLGPLANNGGGTDTMVPLNGSPALDHGISGGAGSDQRGLPRALDVASVANGSGSDGSDIGAVEADAPIPPGLIEVNTLDDHDDGLASYVDCSLREAIRVANGASTPSVIRFRPGLRGTTLMSSVLGPLTITNSMEIIGPGARFLTLDGGTVMSILRVASGDVSISGMTFSRGRVVGTPGRGGSIVNEARLKLDGCWVRDSSARGAVPTTARAGWSGYGGGIYNAAAATLRVTASAFSGNSAVGSMATGSGRAGASGFPGGSGLGGAIYNEGGGILEVSSSTFAGNSVVGGEGGFGSTTGGSGGLAQGGAAANSGSMTLTSVTISGNSAQGGPGGQGTGGVGTPAPGQGGGVASFSAASANQVRNSIIAGNQGTLTGGYDLLGSYLSGGYNFIGDQSTAAGFNATGDQAGTAAARLNPQLSPFGNQGGPTDSFQPLSGSPVLDSGRAFELGTDQRGAVRVYDAPELANAAGGDGTDIGAVEWQPPFAGPPRILTLNPYGAGWQIYLQGVPGRNYRLLRSLTVDGASSALGSAVTADGLGLAEFLDFDAGSAQLFYKAVQAP